MPNGIFTLKQQVLAIREGGWVNPFYGSTFGASFGGAGSGQYLTGPTTSALNFGTGNFTVEFWLYISAYGGGGLTVAFSASNAGQDFQLSFNTGSQYVYWHNSGTQISANSSSSFTPGRWSHIALVRSGTTVSLFADGIRYGTTTNSASINLTNFNIGSYWNSVTAFMVNGFVSNLRITNTAVYNPSLTTLTLPTTALTAISGTQLLTLQNATIIDNSTNNLTITNNGNVGMNVVWPFGGPQPYKPLAVDYLVVAGGGNGGDLVGANRGAGGGGGGGLLQGNIPITAGTSYTVTVGAGSPRFGTGTGGVSVFGPISATGGGAGARSGNNAGSAGGSGGGGSGASYPNGYQGVAGQGNRGGNSTDDTASAGGGGAGTQGISGVNAVGGNGGAGVASDISGTRTAYAGGGGGGGTTSGVGGAGGGGNAGSSAGTANTGGGGGGSAGFSDGYAGGSGIVIVSYPDIYAAAASTTGSPTVSTSGTGSIAVNGSTDYMSVTTPALGSGDWTIELWVYLNSVTTTFYYDGRGAGSSGLQPTIYYSSGVGLKYFTNGGDRINGGTLSTGQWYHIAVSRVSGTTRMFINGTQTGSNYSDSNNYVASTTGSGWVAGNSSFYMNGYITNLRIIVGTGLYSGTFAVPSAPLTAVSGTQLLMSTVSGSTFLDSSSSARTVSTFGTPSWNQLSPFATGLGYKNRVYTWTSSGSITF